MSITTDRLVGEIQQMFKNINKKSKLNYWGIANGNQFAPLGCLKCSKCMYDFMEFAEFGPTFKTSLWFCDKDAEKFDRKISLLKNTAEAEKKDFKDLYKKALEPLIKKQKVFEKYAETHRARSTRKNWVFFG
jgi:hypothetical protein